MKPDRIRSGGQTGADQGALVAAKQLGIPTGGWAPKGFRTEAGNCPELAELYGLKECSAWGYPMRTWMNVRDSDGTIWVGSSTSKGYRCTREAADDFEKPFLVVATPEAVVDFIERWSIKELNVAGNRASTNPVIHRATAELLIAAFSGAGQQRLLR